MRAHRRKKLSSDVEVSPEKFKRGMIVWIPGLDGKRVEHFCTGRYGGVVSMNRHRRDNEAETDTPLDLEGDAHRVEVGREIGIFPEDSVLVPAT